MQKDSIAKSRLCLDGFKTGRLTVIGFAGLDCRRNSTWECRCECGRVVTHLGSNIKRAKVSSCGYPGCWPRREKVASRHHDFKCFCSMLARCTSPSGAYRAKGITVCERWINGGFWVFNEDMGDRPSTDHTIDRIDGRGNYEPKNCRWATRKEQQRNISTNRIIECRGLSLTVAEWSERLSINNRTILGRLRRGLSIEASLGPVKKRVKLWR